MEKLRELTRKRKEAHSKMMKMGSKVYERFVDMEQATYCDGALNKKTKELIAVGISVVINCESCMQWHIEQAAKDGADQKEILEAIEVGIEMAGGSATSYARFALDVMEDVFGK